MDGDNVRRAAWFCYRLSKMTLAWFLLKIVGIWVAAFLFGHLLMYLRRLLEASVDP